MKLLHTAIEIVAFAKSSATTAASERGQAMAAPSRVRDRVAAGLMLIGALGAAYSCVSSVGRVLAADQATQQGEAWRMVGFALFAALFTLLAFRPRRTPWLWELLIANKLALTIIEALLISRHAADAVATTVADGILVVFMIAAYILSRGYASWRTR